INMSLGSGPWTTPCDGAWPELTTAFNTLRSAGVTAFVSSGNDNDKILLGFPSCISSAVSVGAVYDANVGSIAWSACTDSSTWADLVVCFSNSHSTELDLLAPGALITSSVNGGGTDEYGGTSMAAPHAAGVAALMLDANPSATADQIESCMETTGVPVTDPDNSVTTPRVDALAAVQCIAPSGDDTDGDGCADVEEQAGAPAPKPGSTGAYDPLAWHDFYDVPVPAMPDAVCANGPKNLAIAMDDVLAVLFYAGTYAGDGGVPNADGVAYDSDKGVDTDADTVADIPADGVPDGQDYDRSPSPDPNPPWNAGPPSGAVAMDDVLAVLAQTGLSCIEPP
ncbi:MAG: S8 family serine peptidase, partial [Dehalococcoidia bacterium]